MDNIKITQGVVEALPFPDDSLDLVFSVVVLPFTDLDKAAMEMGESSNHLEWLVQLWYCRLPQWRFRW